MIECVLCSYTNNHRTAGDEGEVHKGGDKGEVHEGGDGGEVHVGGDGGGYLKEENTRRLNLK